jgi:hypothetical protein
MQAVLTGLMYFLAAATALAQRPLTVSLYGQTWSGVLPQSAVALSIKPEMDEMALEQTMRAVQTSLQPFVKTLQRSCDSLRCSDWLRLKVAMAVAKSAWKSEMERVVGCSALLRAMGYNAVLVASQRRLQLAVEINQPIYFGAMFRLGEGGKQMFMLLDVEKNSIQKSKPKGEMELLANLNEAQTLRALALDKLSFPILPNKPVTKTLTWTFQGKTFSLRVTLNRNLIDYLAEHPQMEVSWYFNQPLTSAFKAQVIEPLKKLVAQEKLTGTAAVDFLLQFSLARPYLEDHKQARGEHCSFVEESLFDDYTDCEDRAYLLAALVQGVLGYNVVGLQFPNHVAVAVEIPENRQMGKKIIFEGRTYIVCDPSYSGSTVGEIIEPFKDAAPQSVIKIDEIKFVD